MYTRPAAAERKAWSRFIFISGVGPKEPSSASSTPHSEHALFASTPMIRTPLDLRLTFWNSLNVVVVTGTALSPSVRVEDPLCRVDASTVGINCRGSFWCPWLSSGIHHNNLKFAEWISGSMNEAAPRKKLTCAQIWDSGAQFRVPTGGMSLCLALMVCWLRGR